ncbi:MAG: PQQ-dependent sugar dehydrogenase [Actinobacteria bacterium]|nr:PQQ-dependent sugar dehydrogenase [Actinomycetota bacterium]
MTATRTTAALLAALVLALVAPAPGRAIPAGTRVETYEGGLDFPVDMAWVPGTNKIFFTEKSGRIRVMVGRRLLAEPCARLDVESSGERGLLGIALSPRFDTNRKLFVYYTNLVPLEHRIASFVVENNRCTAREVIVDGLNASSSGYHNGGQLEFVRGKLFVTVGDAHDAATAQDTSNRLGKVLRYNPDGSIPDGNPFSTQVTRNPVWSYGHRNGFGLARRPGTTRLYETENGPQCDDEVNRIRRGRNYGWGSGYDCGSAGVGPNPKGPLFRWSSTIAPTDATWYVGALRAMSGHLYVGDFNTGRLHRFSFNRQGGKVVGHRVVHDSGDGIIDVSKGPGGWLYFLTPTMGVAVMDDGRRRHPAAGVRLRGARMGLDRARRSMDDVADRRRADWRGWSSVWPTSPRGR